MKPRLVVALVLVLVGVVGSAVYARQPDATVTYYFIPGCTTCAKTSARIDKVVKACGRNVKLRLVENSSMEGRMAARTHGFASHGLVLEDASGKPELVEADHRVFAEHVDAALKRLLPN